MVELPGRRSGLDPNGSNHSLSEPDVLVEQYARNHVGAGIEPPLWNIWNAWNPATLDNASRSYCLRHVCNQLGGAGVKAAALGEIGFPAALPAELCRQLFQ